MNEVSGARSFCKCWLRQSGKTIPMRLGFAPLSPHARSLARLNFYKERKNPMILFAATISNLMQRHWRMAIPSDDVL